MILTTFIYENLKKFAQIMGFNLILIKKPKKAKNYELILPAALYAPWLSDISFNKVYKTIKKYTLVDKYRCYELWQLVAQTAKLQGALIEVGVWRGGSGALIAKKTKLVGIKDNVYLCDTFKGVVKAGTNDSIYKGGEHSNASKKIVEDIIRKLKLHNTKILTGIFPEETAKKINNNKFRFCHIDVDVYQSAKDIVDWIWPKLVIGGIIVFDDYGLIGCDGVTRFVNEERNKPNRIVIHNLNGHAIIVKLPN